MGGDGEGGKEDEVVEQSRSCVEARSQECVVRSAVEVCLELTGARGAG